MKTLLVGVAVAGFVVLPLFAASQAAEGPSYSRAYPQKKRLEKHLTKHLGGRLPRPQWVRVELQSAYVECGPHEGRAMQYGTRVLS
jgi:hypothetical protein